MDKRDLLIVFLSQFDLSSNKIKQIVENMKELSIACFKKTKFDKSVLSDDVYQKMLECADETLVETYIKNLKDREIGVTTIYMDDYPSKLKEMIDSPYILYYKGDLALAERPTLSVVGTRKPTNYGRMATEKLVRDVASAGVVIVSGLAYGIDSIAHRTTLEAGGKTIAVLGSGFDHVYPAQHKSLADEIARKGLLVSEMRPKRTTSKYLFPLRNRIIAGLGDGTLITEAGIKSGTIHTKEFALEFGRNIYAVPGNIDSENSQLTNEVIKTGQGACVVCAKDILDDYSLKVEQTKMQFDNLSNDEKEIVKLLESGMKDVDDLTKNIQMSINNFNTCLTILEIRGIIRRLPGGMVALN